MSRITGFVALIPLWLCAYSFAAEIHRLEVDFQEVLGRIRPLHGVNLGPLCYRGTVDLTQYHRELAVPLTRLHDVPWAQTEAVDIHTIFRDFREDADEAKNYDFRLTDDYVESVLKTGSRIVYRLGESIEHTPRKYWVHPPVDPAKWAVICRNIIRHYNEGWAAGFHHNVEYWEIWNEPDVRPQMWTGSDAEFFKLFDVTAKEIKARFQGTKVGGPAIGNIGAFVGGEFKPSRFAQDFLTYCRDNKTPLDFLSWHCYASDPWELPRRAQAVQRLLEQYGFPNCENHLNEWNYLPGNDWEPVLSPNPEMRRKWEVEMGGPAAAAFVGSALMLFQDSPISAANFYTGAIHSFGLFDIHGAPRKTFYAFKAFRQLLNTAVRVRATGAVDGKLALLAGLNEERTAAQLMIANLASPAVDCELVLEHLPWKAASHYKVWHLDQESNMTAGLEGVMQIGGKTLRLKLPQPSVALIRFDQ